MFLRAPLILNAVLPSGTSKTMQVPFTARTILFIFDPLPMCTYLMDVAYFEILSECGVGCSMFIEKCLPQDALWRGVLSGGIDMVVSDHSPCTADLKLLDSGDFTKAWGGISSVQFGKLYQIVLAECTKNMTIRVVHHVD
jgi:hypothetical protein